MNWTIQVIRAMMHEHLIANRLMSLFMMDITFLFVFFEQQMNKYSAAVLERTEIAEAIMKLLH